jgi:hypothetical protein
MKPGNIVRLKSGKPVEIVKYHFPTKRVFVREAGPDTNRHNVYYWVSEHEVEEVSTDGTL